MPIAGVERVKSLKRDEYVAMKIVHKSVVSNRENYMVLLQRLVEMYQELHTDDISKLARPFTRSGA